jgi:hypothetical protein
MLINPTLLLNTVPVSQTSCVSDFANLQWR